MFCRLGCPCSGHGLRLIGSQKCRSRCAASVLKEVCYGAWLCNLFAGLGLPGRRARDALWAAEASGRLHRVAADKCSRYSFIDIFCGWRVVQLWVSWAAFASTAYKGCSVGHIMWQLVLRAVKPGLAGWREDILQPGRGVKLCMVCHTG